MSALSALIALGRVSRITPHAPSIEAEISSMNHPLLSLFIVMTSENQGKTFPLYFQWAAK
jgi:hypothetical protein